MSASQDTEAGDGTTTVVVMCGALLGAAQQLLQRGVHATVISEAFGVAAREAEKVMTAMAIPVDLTDREALIKSAVTSLSSKVVSQYSNILAPLAVDCVLRVIDPATATNVDLKDIKIVKKVGGTIDDTCLIEGLIFDQKASHAAGGPTRVENAKIALIQFCLSAPKSDVRIFLLIVIYDFSSL